jgi:hypothetical protein
LGRDDHRSHGFVQASLPHDWQFATDMAHYAELWRSALDDAPTAGLALLGRDLADYAAVVDGGQ